MARRYELKNPFTESPSSEAADLFSAESQQPQARRIYTVTELTRQIQQLLQESYSYGVWVEGEISDSKVYPSGHLWFDLKDAQSTLKSVMWRDDVKRLKFQPEHGLQVVCFGRPDFYPPRGEMKFVVQTIEPKGLGALQLAFEQLKERLQKDGLFDEARKRPLPLFPERIGIVTSPRGAAIDDMLRILTGHAPAVLFPSRVQGDGAAEAIARGIRELNHLENLDLLIVGRGGGSLEDLWAFNEEIVARAIASSRLPVISAVGHEKDVTISDLVADLRAPTPTKAAEMVLAQRRACLERFLRALEETAFAEPETWLEELKENLIELEERLVEGLREPLIAGCQRLQVLQRDLLSCSPQALILHQAERLHRLQSTLVTGFVHTLEQATSHFLGLVGRLNALSPLKVLARGYSITFDAQGRIVKRASSVKPGDLIETKLHRGRLKSKVESIE